MIKGLPSVDFKPHDDLTLDLLVDRGKHVNHIVVATGTEKWFLQLDYVNMGKPATVYFDINDAIIFKEKVEQSLKEQVEKGFNPKNTILNPGQHRIDHILTGFPQYKQKGGWHILLDNGLNRLAEIYFSQEDADTFNNKMNQSFAAAVFLCLHVIAIYTVKFCRKRVYQLVITYGLRDSVRRWET